MVDTSQLRTRGGYLVAPNLALVEIQGPDAQRFLQAQTTSNINALNEGDWQRSSLLDRKAKLVADFSIYKAKDKFWIVANATLTEPILSHLDKFRFADHVEFVDQTENFELLIIEGPLAGAVLASALEEPCLSTFVQSGYAIETVSNSPVSIFNFSMIGENGYLFASQLSNPDVKKHLIKTACAKGFIEIGEEILETARIEAGILKYGTDYDTTLLLPETTLDQIVVSYEKGCFQGQEVLARVRSHGAPTKALVGLKLEPVKDLVFSIDTPIICKADTIGWIKSNCYSQFLECNIAIALMKRDFREPGKKYNVTIDGSELVIEVEILPFYKASSTKSTAKGLYEEALQLYAEEDDEHFALEQSSPSINLLEEAIALDPVFEDAYETLGVILSRRDRLDDAIKTMEHLARLNPDSIMAHTNLSVFYLEKGWKDKAEEEKAISTTIQMLKASRDAKAREEAEKEKVKNLQEIKERLSMFEEVLEIDSEDFLANYGRGSCLVELADFQGAIESLEKALSIKPNHTVAYLELARAYIGKDLNTDAARTLEKGASVASRQGDLKPLKKMQLLQHQLKEKQLN